MKFSNGSYLSLGEYFLKDSSNPVFIFLVSKRRRLHLIEFNFQVTLLSIYCYSVGIIDAPSDNITVHNQLKHVPPLHSAMK